MASTEARRTRRCPGRVHARTRTRCLGHRPAWLPYLRYGSMQTRNPRGNKAPVRSQRRTTIRGCARFPISVPIPIIGIFGNRLNPTKNAREAEFHRNRSISEIPETTRNRLCGVRTDVVTSRRTAAARAPWSYTVARPARPRSHGCETMTHLVRTQCKSTGFCNYSDTLVSDDTSSRNCADVAPVGGSA